MPHCTDVLYCIHLCNTLYLLRMIKRPNLDARGNQVGYSNTGILVKVKIHQKKVTQSTYMRKFEFLTFFLFLIGQTMFSHEFKRCFKVCSCIIMGVCKRRSKHSAKKIERAKPHISQELLHLWNRPCRNRNNSLSICSDQDFDCKMAITHSGVFLTLLKCPSNLCAILDCDF